MALASTNVPSTPTTIYTTRAQRRVQVHLVNDDPSQSIDVSVWRTYDTEAIAAQLSDEQFTSIAPGEARVGTVDYFGDGVLLVFTAQASGAGNAPLRYWFSQ